MWCGVFVQNLQNNREFRNQNPLNKRIRVHLDPAPETPTARSVAVPSRSVGKCKRTPRITMQRRLASGRAAAGDSRAYSSSKVIHRWRGGACISPPQPTVNNFGGGAKMSRAKLSILPNPWVGHAGSGRRIPRSNATTFTRRLSLRHPAPGCQGTLRTFRLQVQTWQRRTSISDSIRPGPRAQTNANRKPTPTKPLNYESSNH